MTERFERTEQVVMTPSSSQVELSPRILAVFLHQSQTRRLLSFSKINWAPQENQSGELEPAQNLLRVPQSSACQGWNPSLPKNGHECGVRRQLGQKTAPSAVGVCWLRSGLLGLDCFFLRLRSCQKKMGNCRRQPTCERVTTLACSR